MEEDTKIPIRCSESLIGAFVLDCSQVVVARTLVSQSEQIVKNKLLDDQS